MTKEEFVNNYEIMLMKPPFFSSGMVFFPTIDEDGNSLSIKTDGKKDIWIMSSKDRTVRERQYRVRGGSYILLYNKNVRFIYTDREDFEELAKIVQKAIERTMN